MADNNQQQPQDNQLYDGDIDEGLERDLRDVLGWDDPSDDSQGDNQTPKAEENTPPEGSQQEPVEPQEPQEPVVDLDGEQIPVSQVRAWRKGHLMLDDYTRKTQQLGDERRTLEQERQRLAPLAQVEQLLQQNPRIAEALQRVLRDQFGVNAQAPNYGPNVSQQAPPPAQQMPGSYQTPVTGQQPYPYSVGHQSLQASPAAMGVDPFLDQRLSRIEEGFYDQQLDRSLSVIRSQADAERQKLGLQPLADDEWTQVSNQLMTEAYNTRQGLEQVWQASTLRSQWAYDAVEAARQAVAQQQRQAQNRQAGAVMNGTSRGGPVAPQQNATPKDFGQATMAALAELRQSGGSLLSSDE